MPDGSLQTVLLPYQQRWIADRAPVKVWEKSRRIGATWCEAADAALDAAAQSGVDWWYLGYNKDMALEFIEAAAGWARRVARAAAAIEEVAFDDDVRAGRRQYSLHRTTLDDALADGLYGRICQVDRGHGGAAHEWSAEAESAWRARIFADYGDDADEELLCIPNQSTTVFMPSALIEGRMNPAIPVVRLTTTRRERVAVTSGSGCASLAAVGKGQPARGTQAKACATGKSALIGEKEGIEGVQLHRRVLVECSGLFLFLGNLLLNSQIFILLIGLGVALIDTSALIRICKPVVRLTVLADVVAHLERLQRRENRLPLGGIGLHDLEPGRREYRIKTLRFLGRGLRASSE
jgi:hypothetical protein